MPPPGVAHHAARTGLGLMRGGDFLSCERPETVLQQDDKLILLGRRPELRRFGDVL